MNNLKTVLLLGLLSGIFLIVGGVLGGQQGMLLALVFAGIMNFISYWFSDKIVLKTYRAAELAESEAPRVYAMVRELAQLARIPMPKVYLIEQDSPNAFATGRNPAKAAIVLSRGIVRLLGEEELKGVIAHELSHVINRDTLLATVAATLAGAVMFLAYQMRWLAFFTGTSHDDDRRGGVMGMLLMAILAPLAATIIQLAISRSREYKADAGSAELTRNPDGLATALEKLADYSKRLPMTASQQTAHLFIVSPLSGKSLLSLFSTHPPIKERVARLRQMRLS
jgi:heat shock protein HtpX